jgi:hypothetical protein
MTGVRWELTLLPTLVVMVGLFKLSLEHRYVSTQNRCHMDLWSAWLVLAHHHHLHWQQLTLHQNPWERVSWLLFMLSAFFQLIGSWLLRVVFLEFGLRSHGPAYLLAIIRTFWSDWTRAWWSLELVLRLLASDNKDQPPPPDHLENLLIWVDSIKMIPLYFAQYICPLSA